MQSTLEKAKEGNKNELISFQITRQIYYSDSCPAGLSGYSNQGHTWQFKVSEDLQISCRNNHALDQHHQRQTQTGRLCIVDDQQHNSQRMDEEIQL